MQYYSYLPDSVFKYIAMQAGLVGAKFAGRTFIGTALARKVTYNILTSVASSSAYKMIMKRLGISIGVSSGTIATAVGLMMLHGLMQRSSMAGVRLHAQCPTLYKKLQPNDLYLLYFLVENAMRPYVTMCNIAEKDPVGFAGEVEAFYQKTYNIIEIIRTEIDGLFQTIHDISGQIVRK